MGKEMVRVFLSYASADEAFADRLAADLGAYSESIFYAKWNIKVGDSIVEKINHGLSSHDNLIVILSRASIQSEWVNRELNSSLMRQLKDRAIRILPVLIEDCDVPPLLADIKYADFRLDYNKGFTSLLETFEADFDLEPYIGLVEGTLSSNSSPYTSKTFAILLKRLMPLQFGCVENLYKIHEHGEVAYSYMQPFESQLMKLMQEKLVERITRGDRDILVFTNLGKLVFSLISAGLNEGVISPTCSH
jgi:hypothetical protein